MSSNDVKNSGGNSISGSHGVSCVPEITLSPSKASETREDVAYLSPMLAFNLGIHTTWVQLWLSRDRGGSDDKVVSEDEQPSSIEISMVDVCSIWQLGFPREMAEGSINMEKAPFKYAYHVRIGHIKVPVLGVPPKSNDYSSLERQEELDNALQEYFKNNRVLARGDMFAVSIVLNAKHKLSSSNEERTIFFKVCIVHVLLLYWIFHVCRLSAKVIFRNYTRL
jgi:peroxin-6